MDTKKTAADRREKAEDPHHGRGRELPPAGPHARKDLTNEDATPGTGSLPDTDEESAGGSASS